MHEISTIRFARKLFHQVGDHIRVTVLLPHEISAQVEHLNKLSLSHQSKSHASPICIVQFLRSMLQDGKNSRARDCLA